MKSSAPTRRLTSLYIISLSSIAALAIAGQFLIQQQLNRQATDLKILTTAQMRQTLCQKLLKNVLAVSLTPDSELKQQRIADLEEALKNWQDSKEGLQSDMQKMLSAAELAEIKPTFEQLEPVSQAITEAATSILQRQSQGAPPLSPPPPPPAGLPNPRNLRDRLTQNSPSQPLPSPGTAKLPTPSIVDLAGPQLLRAEKEFSQLTNHVIDWYGQKAAMGVARLKFMEFALLGVTLGVLVLEGSLVFRPAVKKLQETLDALGVSLRQVAQEREKSEKLLLNILPEPIANRLKRQPKAIADGFAEATVLFADIVGFTELSSRLSPQELVVQLNEIFSAFDLIAERYGLEKIKTIGDAYMVVGGLPDPRPDHAAAIANMALDMQAELQRINEQNQRSLDIRVGINSGPVVAGVIGLKKFIYDLWGDTVNVASRMESHGLPGKIHLTETTHQALIADPNHDYELELRGAIAVKGKGEMQTYWLKGRKSVYPIASSPR
ncbi:MAG: adenylate/guanylate cyclase domain-containing protein [Synechococcales bacterium]|nr:adenylate/guanylate cyclase domain-containing protein [Synechococcales bacterium]